MRLQGGVPGEQQRAAHVHVGDGGTHAEPICFADAEPHGIADSKPDARAHAACMP